LDQEAFEQLYEEHAAGLFRFVLYRTGDRTMAEDLVAEAFARALGARWGFDPERGSAGSWLHSIALNLIRDSARRRAAEQRARERLQGDDRLLQEAAENEAVVERQSVAAAMEKLSEDERSAVAMRFGGDLTVPEIAELTGEPLTTVEGRVYRALRKLRAELAPKA
jgi:RNA polymerase sigma-70 factor (ECF subfamily)